MRIGNFTRIAPIARAAPITADETDRRFAVRGSLLDVYPMGTTAPLRIDLFDNGGPNSMHAEPTIAAARNGKGRAAVVMDESEAQETFDSLLNQVGRGTECIITRKGKAVARMISTADS